MLKLWAYHLKRSDFGPEEPLVTVKQFTRDFDKFLDQQIKDKHPAFMWLIALMPCQTKGKWNRILARILLAQEGQATEHILQDHRAPH